MVGSDLMKVDVSPRKETSQVEIRITVDADEFQPFIEKAARTISKEHSLKGFRPGKAPISVIIDAVGQDHLLKEAMEQALPHFFVEAVIDNKIDAINRPSITVEELGLSTPFRFSAVVDVIPEVTLPDVSSLKVEKRDAEVKDDQIEQELQYLAKTRSTYIDITTAAEKGDRVIVDFDVSMNGSVIEGGSSKNHPVNLGEGHFVPDFENNLVGLAPGGEKTFTMKFPDDYPKEDLRGKESSVNVKAHSVQKRVTPELNDEFAKGLGAFKDLNHLKEELKKNMQEEAFGKEEERYLGELAEKLAENSTFGPIPSALIEKEIDNRIHEFSHMLTYQQQTLEDYLQKEEKTIEQMRSDMREAAEKNVKIGLALRAFAEQEKIEISDQEIEEEANHELSHFKTVDQAAKNIDPEELKEVVSSRLKNRKTLRRLAEINEKK